MASPLTSTHSYFEYKMAKSMFEETQRNIQSEIREQQALWRQCITQNLASTLSTIEPKLQFYLQEITILTIIAFSLAFLVFGFSRFGFSKECSLLLIICFIIQLIFLLAFAAFWFLITIFYSSFWNLNCDTFFVNL